ncbi:MAG TPA: Coenzyme F420 hydrogenase/dehydrogenase, beta subunit C-terminal domain [Stellaceae bacterium]|nr:Coenzyme F420 hydrogenase/dehydrogenase, beta subunit C-terminal domain [Stellaceae bacterium]
MPPDAPLSIEAIVDAGLCIGCGLCRSVAPDAIRIEMSPQGAEIPKVQTPLTEAELALVNQICPGLHVEGRRRDEMPATARWDTIWGPALAMAKGYAADPEVRFRCSAGGGTSALGIHLLESREVDFILHVRASRSEPMRSEAQLSATKAEVLEGAGSRYGPAAPLVDLMQLLDRGRTFAVIGKPCDISAIQNLSRHDPRVDALIRYRIAIVCGGASAFGLSLDLVERFGVRESEVSLLRYRGYGNPGRTRVETKDGRAFEVTYNDLWADESKWRILFRCKICGDALGETADIAISDTWPGGGPSGEDAGFNDFIARTERGAGLLRRSAESGALKLVADMDFRDFDAVQPHQVRKKQAITARLAALRDAGFPVPDYPDLRLDAAGASATEAFRRENTEGMRKRLAKRKPSEPD